MTVDQEFFDAIWGDTEGTVCLSFKTENGFEDEFFKLPEQRNEVSARCDLRSVQGDIYFVPSVLRGSSRKKLAFKGSRVVWGDFDSGLPEFPLAPSVVVESSPGRYHVYWTLDEVCSSQNTLEQTNKELAKSFGADMSGWDCTQLLRVPGTMNRKRSEATPVVLVSSSENRYNLGAFPKV